jgi:hypothetical protein
LMRIIFIGSVNKFGEIKWRAVFSINASQAELSSDNAFANSRISSKFALSVNPIKYLSIRWYKILNHLYKIVSQSIGLPPIDIVAAIVLPVKISLWFVFWISHDIDLLVNVFLMLQYSLANPYFCLVDWQF